MLWTQNNSNWSERRFGNEFSLGTTGRFIYSNLTAGQFSAGQQTTAGKAFAIDVSAFYRKQTVFLNKDAIVSAGANFSNIGTKIGYVDGAVKQFLPTKPLWKGFIVIKEAWQMLK